MKKNNRGFSIVYKYIFSSFTIVLIACVIVGLILYIASVNELKKKHNDMVMYKLSLAVTDIENQYDMLADISYKLSTEVYYKKSYSERNAYYEIDMFEDFAKYKNNSQIIDDYFFFYHNESWVYKTNNAKNTFDVFLSSNGIKEDMTALYKKLNDIETCTIIPCNTVHGKTYIFAWPVYTSGKGNNEGRATIGFFVSPEILKKRIINVTGEITGYVYLFYKDILISNFNAGCTASIPELTSKAASTPDSVLNDNNTRLEYFSPNSNFRIAVDMPESIYGRLDVFSSVNAIYIVIVVLLMILIAIFISYNNYKPIKKLRKKYENIYSDSEFKNELNFIEHVFDNVLQDKIKAENDLHKQYQILRKQILQLVLNGDYRYAALLSKPFMGIRLSGPLYGILAVNFNMAVLDEGKEEEIALLIEDLSNEELSAYFVSTKYEGFYAVIINAADNEILTDALENVKTLLGEQEINTYGTISLCKDIKDFPKTLNLAISNCKTYDIDKLNYYDNTIINYDEQIMNSLIRAVRYGKSDDADFYFNILAEDIQEKAPSFLVERYIFSNVFHRLSTSVSERNIMLDIDHINTILAAADISEILATFNTVIKKLCSLDKSKQQTPYNELKTNTLFENVIEYIDLNFWNSEMSLDMLSEHFGFSGKYISSIIKKGKGKAYKDYLTSLRVKKAQELLMTGGYTVTEVCEKVGYTHLPLFIKTFKNITGHTPSRYINKT